MFAIAELAVVGIIALLVLLMVVRPLVRRIVTPEQASNAAIAGGQTAQEGQAQLEGPDGADRPALPAPSNEASEALKSARAVGDVQAKAVEDLGETIKNNPDEAVTIVRDWLHGDGESEAA